MQYLDKSIVKRESDVSNVCRFVNRDDVDFGLAQDLPAVQTLEMVRDDGGIEVRLLKVVNHSHVREMMVCLP